MKIIDYLVCEKNIDLLLGILECFLKKKNLNF
jgi:hypothetical protein